VAVKAGEGFITVKAELSIAVQVAVINEMSYSRSSGNRFCCRRIAIVGAEIGWVDDTGRGC
jgi:hypothetical protein